MNKLAYLIVFLSVIFNSNAQETVLSPSTDGNVTFTVTTVNVGGNYSPKHVLAIWVKDAAGNFVISRKVMANSRKQHLVKWVANSNYNVVDAITGSTLNNHTTHTISWDCRDVSGAVVPDGTYQIWVEFTSRNSASSVPGPFTSVSFEKSTHVQNLNIPNEPYFINMTLAFEPIGVFLDSKDDLNSILSIQPNPFSDELILKMDLKEASFVNVSLYDINGKRVDELFDGYSTDKSIILNWKASEKGIQLIDGAYFLRMNVGGKISGKKVIFSGK